MNRLDPRLQTSTAQQLLTHERLGHWSAAAFELVQMIACSPVTVTGGFSNTQISLSPVAGPDETVITSIPVNIGIERITLNLNAGALDALADLLERGSVVANAGRTLSLDAIEAILAGLLAPLEGVSVGIGAWQAGDTTDSLCALRFNDATIPAQGSVRALRMLHAAMTSKADRLIAAPLSYLNLPTRGRVAVVVEVMLGLVPLTANDVKTLEPDGAVVLDTVWPNGRLIAGRRFLSTGQGWRLEEELDNAATIVRSGHAIRALDDPALSSTVEQPNALELVRGEDVIATGQLAGVDREGRSLTVFVIDRLL